MVDGVPQDPDLNLSLGGYVVPAGDFGNGSRAVSADGTTLARTFSSGASLGKIELRRNGVPLDVAVGNELASSPSLSADGKTLAFASKPSASAAAIVVRIEDVAGTTTYLRIQQTTGDCTAPNVSADGSTVAYTCGKNAYVYAIRAAAGRNAGAKADLGPETAEPSLSGDGSTVVFTSRAHLDANVEYSSAPGIPLVYRKSAFTSESPKLLPCQRDPFGGPCYAWDFDPFGAPAISGDGRTVAFIAYLGVQANLVVLGPSESYGDPTVKYRPLPAMNSGAGAKIALDWSGTVAFAGLAGDAGSGIWQTTVADPSGKLVRIRNLDSPSAFSAGGFAANTAVAWVENDEPNLAAISGSPNTVAPTCGRFETGHGFPNGWTETDPGHDTGMARIAAGIGAHGLGVGIAAGTPIVTFGGYTSLACQLTLVANAPPRTPPIKVVMVMSGVGLGYGSVDAASCSQTTDDLHRAVCLLRDRGITVVAGAGNDAKPIADRGLGFKPAAFPEVLAATAMCDTDAAPSRLGPACGGAGDDTYSDQSNYVTSPAVAAHTVAGRGLDTLNTAATDPAQTSMATGAVAGATALCFGRVEADAQGASRTVAGPCSSQSPAQVITTMVALAANRAAFHPEAGFDGDQGHPVTVNGSTRTYGNLAFVWSPEQIPAGMPGGVLVEDPATGSEGPEWVTFGTAAITWGGTATLNPAGSTGTGSIFWRQHLPAARIHATFRATAAGDGMAFVLANPTSALLGGSGATVGFEPDAVTPQAVQGLAVALRPSRIDIVRSDATTATTLASATLAGMSLRDPHEIDVQLSGGPAGGRIGVAFDRQPLRFQVGDDMSDTVPLASVPQLGIVGFTGSTTSGAAQRVDSVRIEAAPPAGAGLVAPFTAGDWHLNGAAVRSGTDVVLTNALGQGAVGSAFWPQPIPSASGVLSVEFDAALRGGSGADGLALVFADPQSVAPDRVGGSGWGLGFAGLAGTAVALDTYDAGAFSSSIGIANGVNAAGSGLAFVTRTTTGVPALREGTHHVAVTYVAPTRSAAAGVLTVSVDGKDVAFPSGTNSVTLPPSVRVGFTAANGSLTDDHVVSNVRVTESGMQFVGDPDLADTTEWQASNAKMLQARPSLAYQGIATLHPGATPAPQSLFPSAATGVGGAMFTTRPVASGAGGGMLHVAFDAMIGPGSGADGLSLVLANPAAGIPGVGALGGGLGAGGADGYAIALDTYRNTGEPSANFVGVARVTPTQRGWDPLTYMATASSIPDLRAAVRHVEAMVSAGKLRVSIDGVAVRWQGDSDEVALPDLPRQVLVGFTGATGGKADVHAVANVGISAVPEPTQMLPTWRRSGAARSDGGGIELTPPMPSQRGSAFEPTAEAFGPGKMLHISFDESSGGGTHADGLALVVANSGAPQPFDAAAPLGEPGWGIGFVGIDGLAVALDMWQNPGEPNNNFVGLTPAKTLAYSTVQIPRNASGGMIDFRTQVRHVDAFVTVDKITVLIDGMPVIADAPMPPGANLGAAVKVGFTASTGGATDRHAIANVVIEQQ